MSQSTPLGVKFSFFQLFVDECGGEKMLTDLSTKDIYEQFVMPQTKSLAISMVDNLMRIGKTDVIGSSTVYVCHAWEYMFLDVVESIKLYLQKQYNTRANEIIVWFDLFSYSHYSTENLLPSEDFIKTNVINTVGAIKTFVLIFLPWYDPAVFTRSWCLLELIACIQTNRRFDISMSGGDWLGFLEKLDDDNSIKNILSSIRSENTLASQNNDMLRYAMLHLVPDGYSEINSKIVALVQAWMTSTISDVIVSQIDQPEKILDLQKTLASLYYDQKNYEMAEKLLLRCLKQGKQQYGEFDSRIVKYVNSLAHLYYTQVCVHNSGTYPISFLMMLLISRKSMKKRNHAIYCVSPLINAATVRITI